MMIEVIDKEPIADEWLRLAFGQVIKQLEDELYGSQRELSRVAPLSNSHLRSIETGKVSPKLTTINAIAAAFGTNAAALLIATHKRARELESEAQGHSAASQTALSGEPTPQQAHPTRHYAVINTAKSQQAAHTAVDH